MKKLLNVVFMALCFFAYLGANESTTFQKIMREANEVQISAKFSNCLLMIPGERNH